MDPDAHRPRACSLPRANGERLNGCVETTTNVQLVAFGKQVGGLGKESAGTLPISSNEKTKVQRGAARKMKRNTHGVRRVLGSGLGLALSSSVWSQGLVEVVSVNSGASR